MAPRRRWRGWSASSSTSTASRIVAFDVVFAERRPLERACRCSSGSAHGRAEGRAASSRRRSRELRPRLDHDGAVRAGDQGPPGGARLLPQQRPRTRAQRHASASRCSTTGHFRGRGDPVHAVDRLRREPAGVPGRGAGGRALQPARRTTTASSAACRCSPSSRAPTTSRCRSRWCARSSGFPKVEPGYAPDRFLSARLRGPGVAQGRAAAASRSTRTPRADPLPRRQGQLPLRLARRRATSTGSPVERLKGKIALVGTTAPGLLDLRATPVDSVYPGRGSPRQPDRRHARPQHQAEAALRARRRGGPAAARRRRCSRAAAALSARSARRSVFARWRSR